MSLTRLITRSVLRQPLLLIRRLSSSKPITAIPQSVMTLLSNVEFREQRNFSVFSKSPDYSEVPQMDLVLFEDLCSETLELLTDYFEELVESDPKLSHADVAYSDGVLTVKFGGTHGTYVINRQSPNRQIWLSSPTSGPKRYDWIDGNWVYKHDGVALHKLLQNEISEIISVDVNFLKLALQNKKV